VSGVGSTEPPRGGAGSAGAGATTGGGGAGSAGAEAGMDPELARKNMIWGWALAAIMVALALGTVVVALIYLAVD
jgi:hypothetical protein